MEEPKINLLSSVKRIFEDSDGSKYVEKLMFVFKKHMKGSKNDDIDLNKTGNYKSKILEEKSLNGTDEKIYNDSGIITSICEELLEKKRKKIRFSPENTVIEIEANNNHHHVVESAIKCIAHISEMPLPQKISIVSTNDLKKSNNTINVLTPAEIISDEVILSPEEGDKENSQKYNFIDASSTSAEIKRDINLFDDRQSTRLKRRGICIDNVDRTYSFINESPRLLYNSCMENHNTKHSRFYSVCTQDDKTMLDKLKIELDIECAKMKQTSNVLNVIKRMHMENWSEELLAEKILLETGEKSDLVLKQMRDLNFGLIQSPSNVAATITLSNLKCLLNENYKKAKNNTEFFLMTLSDDKELLMSKIVRPFDKKLVVNDSFTFINADSYFNIKVKVFSIKMVKRKKATFLCKKAVKLCSMSKIHKYITSKTKGSNVLKSSFKICGETDITKHNIGDSSCGFLHDPNNCCLEDEIKFSLTVNMLKIKSQLRGFLTVGTPNVQKDLLFWERKWCVLTGSQFAIFNYPIEEDFGKPLILIDLTDCIIPLSTDVHRKKKRMLLKTLKSNVNGTDNKSDGTKSNFILKQYYFCADTNNCLQLWIEQINSILNTLKDWKKLAFLNTPC